jgi:ABC-type multidrug transport system ATPase subunit
VVRRAHSCIGYLHERPYVELRFTARSYLTYMAQLSGYRNVKAQQRVESALEQVDYMYLQMNVLPHIPRVCCNA